jgi:choice-of-anchor B domain-containing protein
MFNSDFTSFRKMILVYLLLCFSNEVVRAQPELTLLSHLKLDSVTLSGCWHYVDSVGGEYALVGHSRGMSVVAISDPTVPVELFRVPGKPSNWREVKTWGGFAYVGSEAAGSGITIVDLRALPVTIAWKVWYGDSVHLIERSHTVQAEGGYLYVFGGGPSEDGAMICSLDDPWQPRVVGVYSEAYVHDGYIRGDTLWTSEIFEGRFGVVDITDRSAPQVLITHPTPFLFNHNAGLSDDGRVLYTTDEKLGAPLAAFDVGDLENIRLLDRYYPSFDPTREVHNVRVLGNFLINPSYGGQLTVVDASRPENLVETERALLGTSLVWDADPYLPSGLLFATAKSEGLFIFSPVYRRAAHLEGLITDAGSGLPINRAWVRSVGLLQDSTGMDGRYRTGAAVEGVYDLEFGAEGFVSEVWPGVKLVAGEVVELDIALEREVAAVWDDGRDACLRVGVRGVTVGCDCGGWVRVLGMGGLVSWEGRVGAGGSVSLEGLPQGWYVVELRGRGGLLCLGLFWGGL